jgi:signal peptidase I
MWLRRRTWICGAVLAAAMGCGGAGANSGDRVLVSKANYETGIRDPKRFDVVVFKFPDRPVENNTPKNYIKRLLGLPGEILAFFFGRLHRWAPQPGEAPPYDDKQDGVDPLLLRTHRFMHEDDELARKWFEEGKFEIVRKTPDIMMALRRNVYSNDHQAKDMAAFPRWQHAKTSTWKGDGKTGFIHTDPGSKDAAKIDADKNDAAKNGADKNAADQAGIDWLRYQHLVRPLDGPVAGNLDIKPQLITDFMSYNSFVLDDRNDRTPKPNWVGDLMLEAEVEATKSDGEFMMQLSKGIHRFEARFDLASGVCTLVKNEYEEADDAGTKVMKLTESTELDKKGTKLRGPGTYTVRFANIDARLTVWVDRELPFGHGKDYPPPEVRNLPEEKDLDDITVMRRRGPTLNDLEPASFGSRGGAVHVRHLRLFHDTYYSLEASKSDVGDEPASFWSNPDAWRQTGAFRTMKFKTLYVQPGHYLCLGDNSQASSDSREWGTVPERLMLGRALLVYYPFDRAGAIR